MFDCLLCYVNDIGQGTVMCTTFCNTTVKLLFTIFCNIACLLKMARFDDTLHTKHKQVSLYLVQGVTSLAVEVPNINRCRCT
jgi:hypothetical protein